MVPPARATRNALRVRVPGDRCKAFSAWRSELVGLDVSPCLSALAMGDKMAREIVNAAREGVLHSFGALRPREQAARRSPFPRGHFVEVLNIEDHSGFRSCHGLVSPFGPTPPPIGTAGYSPPAIVATLEWAWPSTRANGPAPRPARLWWEPRLRAR